MSVKIDSFEIENTKRIKTVSLEPSPQGLTVIGGRNGQGKTSVLDAITWALAGERYRPSNPQREGSVLPPNIRIVLDNGLVVERKGKNSALKVTKPEGGAGGQQLLNEFISTFALDLPKFMAATGKEKADMLLDIVGVKDIVYQLRNEEAALYNQRRTIGQIADQKQKYAAEQPYFPDAPKDLVSPIELIRQQQEILARNGENQRKRNHLQELQTQHQQAIMQAEALRAKYEEVQQKLQELEADLNAAYAVVSGLYDESTAELEENIANCEEINRRVRANLDKEKAEDDAAAYVQQYRALSVQIDETRKKMQELLNSSEMPLDGLSVVDGELYYHGAKWDCMSASEQLKVAAAIVRKQNPNCGFILMDKLEQMDTETLAEFGSWLESEGLQVIATRVSTGDECSIIIEDGCIVENNSPAVPSWDWK